jgi:hypothetical protein
LFSYLFFSLLSRLENYYFKSTDSSHSKLLLRPPDESFQILYFFYFSVLQFPFDSPLWYLLLCWDFFLVCWCLFDYLALLIHYMDFFMALSTVKLTVFKSLSPNFNIWVISSSVSLGSHFSL